MKAILILALATGLSSCVGPMTAAGPAQKDPSGMTVRHESIGAGKQILTVTDTRFGMSTVAASHQDMTVVAHRYAARVFPSGYLLEDTTHGDGRTGRPINPSKTFIVTERR
jgi:hypothetical protein